MKKLNHPKNISKLIKKLNRKDLTSRQRKEIIGEISIGWLKRTDDFKLDVFRGRKNKKGERFKHLDELLINKDVSKIGMNRCNLDGEGILYCSLGVETVMKELDLDIGDQFTYVRIISKDYITSTFMGLSDKAILKQFHIDLNQPYYKLANIINNFFKAEFSRSITKRDDYLNSIFIAQMAFNIPNVSCLQYQSVKCPDSPTAINFAFKDDVIKDGRIMVNEVKLCEKLSDDKVRHITHANISSNGELEWP